MENHLPTDEELAAMTEALCEKHEAFKLPLNFEVAILAVVLGERLAHANVPFDKVLEFLPSVNNNIIRAFENIKKDEA